MGSVLKRPLAFVTFLTGVRGSGNEPERAAGFAACGVEAQRECAGLRVALNLAETPLGAVRADCGNRRMIVTRECTAHFAFLPIVYLPSLAGSKPHWSRTVWSTVRSSTWIMDLNSAQSAPRRRFLERPGAWAGVTAAVPAVTKAQTRPAATGAADFLPKYALAQNYKSLKQLSYDRTGGNADRFQVKAGETQELFNSTELRRDHA